MSTSWLRVLSDRGEVRRNEDGSYPWPEVAEDYEAYQGEVDAGEKDAAREEYERARTRKALADAKIRETELAVRAGELIPQEEVLEKVRRPLEEVDGRLRAAPRQHAKEWAKRLGVTRAEAIALIGDLVEDIRADLRSAFEDAGDAG